MINLTINTILTWQMTFCAIVMLWPQRSVLIQDLILTERFSAGIIRTSEKSECRGPGPGVARQRDQGWGCEETRRHSDSSDTLALIREQEVEITRRRHRQRGHRQWVISRLIFIVVVIVLGMRLLRLVVVYHRFLATSSVCSAFIQDHVDGEQLGFCIFLSF